MWCAFSPVEVPWGSCKRGTRAPGMGECPTPCSRMHTGTHSHAHAHHGVSAKVRGGGRGLQAADTPGKHKLSLPRAASRRSMHGALPHLLRLLRRGAWGVHRRHESVRLVSVDGRRDLHAARGLHIVACTGLLHRKAATTDTATWTQARSLTMAVTQALSSDCSTGSTWTAR